MSELARLLNIDPRVSTPATEPTTPATFAAFCEQRRLDATQLLSRWGVRETTHKGRSALRYKSLFEKGVTVGPQLAVRFEYEQQNVPY